LDILLDSHILLWALLEPEKVSATNISLMRKRENVIFISAVSLAEIRIKQAIGKLTVPENFDDEIHAGNYVLLPLLPEHTAALASLPLHHRDPFDRMLIAQAIAENLTLITADKDILKYDLKLLAN
jgi:PIN domain nuclease of toxin-antitoxin system